MSYTPIVCKCYGWQLVNASIDAKTAFVVNQISRNTNKRIMSINNKRWQYAHCSCKKYKDSKKHCRREIIFNSLSITFGWQTDEECAKANIFRKLSFSRDNGGSRYYIHIRVYIVSDRNCAEHAAHTMCRRLY